MRCRFSVEWARIEPEEGEFSYAALEHYRRMLAACHEHGIRPMLTFHHFAVTRWLHHYGGGWTTRPERFALTGERVTQHLGDLIGAGCTLNRPNISSSAGADSGINPRNDPWWETAAQRLRTTTDRLGLFQFNATPQARDIILKAHRRGYEAIKSVRGDFPLGLTIALHDFSKRVKAVSNAWRNPPHIGGQLSKPLRGDDFVGVQNYARMVIGADGLIPPAEDVERNQMGEEVYPEALGGAVRYAAQVTGIPVYVTENGLATTADFRVALNTLSVL
ncbi:MAG: glycoside hydrolase family 1 protein [Chloroflexi bacterium]|uniref:family 1 glycosylhydrolase n=1 Tax=Candidatus Flexifilum breve TaxID=3140694 RepID=UPI003135D642|nr:glycoside hydrolase family 1 protein [Chloroflexota bacterium]